MERFSKPGPGPVGFTGLLLLVCLGFVPFAAAQPEVAPRTLALAEDDAEAKLGAAMRLAAQGQLRRATQLLSGRRGGDELAQRIARERERLLAVVFFRDALLRDARMREWTFTVKRSDGPVQGRVVDVSEDSLSLQNGESVTELRKSELNAKTLYEHAREHDLFFGAWDWIGAWLLLLGDDPAQADAQLAGDSKMLVALKSDRGDYERLAGIGTAALHLLELSEASVGDLSVGDAREHMARIETLMTEYRELDLVRSRVEPLRAIAQLLLARSFDPGRRECMGLDHATLAFDSGRIKVKYSFDDAEELADFGFVTNYPHFFAAEPLTVGRNAEFSIREGTLVAVGSGCYRLPLPLKAPFALRYGVILTASVSEFMVGMADDGRDQFIGCAPGGDVFVRDADIDLDVAPSEFTFYMDQEYRAEVLHDGDSVRYLLNGEEVSKTTDLGTRTRGNVFIFCHSNYPVLLTDFEIDGMLDEAQLGAARERWVAAELARIFP